MFSGIIENKAELIEVEMVGTNINFTFKTDFVKELKVDQSIAHNGVCLTVTELLVIENKYKVTAIKETLERSNLGNILVGDFVNLERSISANSLLDGHIVQGHVDTTAICIDKKDEKGSYLFTFEYEKNSNRPEYITVEKGSITINGVSLTVFNSGENIFSVAIIPYTFEHTNFNKIEKGSKVNLEFDILGKYVTKLLQKGYLNKK